MKFGVRKPSIKKSIKARTTGKVKRKIKKAVNPVYGKKGMGYVNDPKKAVYNKVYNKTTVGVGDLIDTPKTTGEEIPEIDQANFSAAKYPYSRKMYKGTGIFLIVAACLLAFMGLFCLPIGLIFIGLAILFFIIGKTYLKIAKLKAEAENMNEDQNTGEKA